MRALLFVALAGFLAPSWAQNSNVPLTISQISARQVAAKWSIEAAVNQIWSNTAAAPRTVSAAVTPAGSVVLSSMYKGPSPIPGQVIDVAVKRTLPWASISRAFAKSLPLISTALALKEIADAIRCREAVGGSGECDLGQNETTQTQVCFTISNGWTQPPAPGACGVTIGAAATAWTVWATNQANAKAASPPKSFTVVSCTATQCTFNAVQVSSTLHAVATPSTAQVSACPAVALNGGTVYPVKGVDGKCPTYIYVPQTEDQVATKAETWGDKAKAPLVVQDLNNAGKPVDHPFPALDPGSSVYGPRETTNKPDGTTTTKDTRYDFSPTADGYQWTPTTIVKDWPAGSTPTAPGTVTGGTSTTGTAPKDDPITCGLPNTPACKIDETGTPTSGNISKAEVDASKQSGLDKITSLGQVQAPQWTWSFSLPSNCSAIQVGPFLSQTVTVDLCAYQPMIHDLVSLIWAAFTAWALVGMVGRTFATG